LHLLDDLLAYDVVGHCEATPGLEVNNLEQFKDFLRMDAEVFPINVQTLEHILIDGDMAPHGTPCPPRGVDGAYSTTTIGNGAVAGTRNHMACAM
jgi:hypothetical protein